MRRLIWNENDQSGPQKVKRLSCIPKNYWNIVFELSPFFIICIVTYPEKKRKVSL